MKYLPSAKSPLWQMIFAAQFFIFAYLVSIGNLSLHHDTYSLGIAIPMNILILLVTLPVTTLLAALAIRNHNKTHPNDKVSIFQTRPPELIDNDERLASITAHATRRVYLYHNLALPLLALALLFAQPSLPTTVVLVGILTMGHYITYWIGIRPALQD